MVGDEKLEAESFSGAWETLTGAGETEKAVVSHLDDLELAASYHVVRSDAAAHGLLSCVVLQLYYTCYNYESSYCFKWYRLQTVLRNSRVLLVSLVVLVSLQK